MKIYGLDHVQLAMPAGEEEAARKFYGGLLGLTEIPKPENLAKRGGVWFEGGTLRLHLGVEQDFKAAKKAHPAMLVDGLDTLSARLQLAGVAVITDEPLEGYYRVYVSDPFSNRIELMEVISLESGYGNFDPLTRRRIGLEKAINELGNEIDILKPDATWLEDKEWDAFIDAWFKLIRHFEGTSDTFISLLSVEEYVVFMRLLRKALFDEELPAERRELVEEAIITLDGIMEEIGTEAIVNLRNQHPELGI